MTTNALKTEAFRQAWDDWIAHLRAKRKPPPKTTVQRQIARLESWGHDMAILAIERSIENNWQGLFEPQDHGSRAGPQEELLDFREDQ